MFISSSTMFNIQKQCKWTHGCLYLLIYVNMISWSCAISPSPYLHDVTMFVADLPARSVRVWAGANVVAAFHHDHIYVPAPEAFLSERMRAIGKPFEKPTSVSWDGIGIFFIALFSSFPQKQWFTSYKWDGMMYTAGFEGNSRRILKNI